MDRRARDRGIGGGHRTPSRVSRYYMKPDPSSLAPSYRGGIVGDGRGEASGWNGRDRNRDGRLGWTGSMLAPAPLALVLAGGRGRSGGSD